LPNAYVATLIAATVMAQAVKIAVPRRIVSPPKPPQMFDTRLGRPRWLPP